MLMRLRRGTSETLNLSGGSGTILGCTYLDAAADAETEEVTETIEVVLEGTAANVLADERQIERWLEEARRFQEEGNGERVWLEMDVVGSGDWQRSEVLGGMVTRGTSMRMLLGGQIQIGVQVRRRNWWEAYNETSVALSNGNGTNVTTGLAVFNGSDGSGSAPAMRHNYAQIGAGVIGGTIPAPARLELTNTYASSSGLEDIWVGHNFSSDPANLAHVLEAEAATGGTTTASASSSGGYFKLVSVSEGSEQTLLSWALSTTLLSAARGRYFGVMMRRALGLDTGAQYRLKLKDGASVVWSGGLSLVENANRLINLLDVAQLPPWLPGIGGVRGLTLELSGARIGTGSLSVYVDFLMLMALDSHRQFKRIGAGLDQNRKLIDDPVDGVMTSDSSGGLLSGDFVATGPGIWLVPNVLQRVYFMMHGITVADGPIDRSLSVVVKYRARRLRL